MKKRKSELDYEDYVCPMTDIISSAQSSTQRSVKRQDSISSNTSQMDIIENQRTDKVTDV